MTFTQTETQQMSKPNETRDDPEQSQRFLDVAREVEAEEQSPEYERLVEKITKSPPLPSLKRKK